MIAYNGARLKIVLEAADMLDYGLFCGMCANADIPPLQLGEWAQKIGMVQVALRRHPNLEPIEAYRKFVSEMNNIVTISSTKVSTVTFTQSSGCSSCGGGKVR